jgi:cell division protein FtsB
MNYARISKEEYYIQHSYCRLFNYEANTLLDYITNLQQIEQDHKETNATLMSELAKLEEENERLKQNQVKALNRIRDFINSSKCEITEGSYSNDKHSQYWSMFKRFAEELQDKIKGIDTKDYVYIPKWREQELLNQEEQLEDYKSRCEKASEYIKEKARNNCWIDQYEASDLINILQNGSDKHDPN